MSSPAVFFDRSYAAAREGFLAAADALGLDVDSRVHPLRGRDGETLAMDVVLDGDPGAESLLMVSSACHGIEGYCGSGVQRALLADDGLRAAARAAGVAVLHVHALNPYGFSWWRRTTQENVDLNRNVHDFHAPLPANPGYEELAAAIVPRQWPSPEAERQLAEYAERHGARALQHAISGGQHTHPQGLFYGGQAPTWSQQTLRQVLRDHAQRCRRLAWIDLHTGLGPEGVGERIFAGPDDVRAVARARAWWGERVTSIYDGSSSSARLTGLIWLLAGQECPQAEYTGIALEYGTVPLNRMIDALRADQWLENHPEAAAPQREAIKRQVFEAFFVDRDDWKQRILVQGREAARQAVAGLAGA
ncbi:MAG: M14 family metallopeptidase [Rubrivivax sp.]